MAPNNNGNDGAEPEVDLWSGGLKWALEEGYQSGENLQGVRKELLLWLENLNELIQVLGPQATAADVLERAVDEGDDDPELPDDDDDDDDD